MSCSFATHDKLSHSCVPLYFVLPHFFVTACKMPQKEDKQILGPTVSHLPGSRGHCGEHGEMVRAPSFSPLRSSRGLNSTLASFTRASSCTRAERRPQSPAPHLELCRQWGSAALQPCQGPFQSHQLPWMEQRHRALLGHSGHEQNECWI